MEHDFFHNIPVSFSFTLPTSSLPLYSYCFSLLHSFSYLLLLIYSSILIIKRFFYSLKDIYDKVTTLFFSLFLPSHLHNHLSPTSSLPLLLLSLTSLLLHSSLTPPSSSLLPHSSLTPLSLSHIPLALLPPSLLLSFPPPSSLLPPPSSLPPPSPSSLPPPPPPSLLPPPLPHLSSEQVFCHLEGTRMECVLIHVDKRWLKFLKDKNLLWEHVSKRRKEREEERGRGGEGRGEEGRGGKEKEREERCDFSLRREEIKV